MSELILHQYAESPFSEKVRLLLGYKGVSYQSVEIPIIMPRPDLMPLTGGYRKTPVLQIGADIYCDSAIICRVINEMVPEKNIYPEASIAAIETMAYWTDTFFFKVCVAVAFQPKAAATNPLFQDEEAASAFMADRAEFSKGSTELGMAFEIAEPHFLAHLNNLDRQLGEGDGFLFGDQPVIADFSTFHNCWFIYTRDVLRDYFSPFEHLLAWYDRMQGFGHGTVEKIEGSAALSHANSVQPQELRDTVFLDNVEPGQQVSVMPIDYGFQPVNGELLSAGLDEIIIARTDDKAGRVLVHFPRMGFQIT
jgi:glutathione S-transferase